ncbi:lengsin [Plakobranchus ocellatus]|uniref:Lengsin n=1 Tax=Plakobranchus ocellatus TaxID=259542 RepID=A0AAV3Z8N2_9GAST|nr:lengsin [Plakobranchus ocellatus]
MSISFGRLSEGRYGPEEFDIVFVSCVDLHGVARGRFVLRSSFPGVIKHGLGMTKGALLAGVKGDMPIGLTDLLEQGWTSGVQMPDMTTLRPLSWLSTRTWKVGHVICDFETVGGEREVTSSREIAQAQIRALRNLGFEAAASAVAEFTIFYKDTTKPVELHEDTSPLLFCLAEALERSGMQIETVGLGLEPGKLQDTLSSSASNPYLVVAAVVAAGVDGLTNNTELPLKDFAVSADHGSETPESLQEALEGLDSDVIMKSNLGELFVQRYLYLKREFEIKRFEDFRATQTAQDGVAPCSHAIDRAIYMLSL